MAIAVTLTDLLSSLEQRLPVDVRRPEARASSGRTIPQALRGRPDEVAEWGRALHGRKVVVFCVHGHEISQGIADRLTELGIDAVYLEGGFAAWETAHNPVAMVGAEP